MTKKKIGGKLKCTDLVFGLTIISCVHPMEPEDLQRIYNKKHRN